jgi:hypothetical protein
MQREQAHEVYEKQQRAHEEYLATNKRKVLEGREVHQWKSALHFQKELSVIPIDSQVNYSGQEKKERPLSFAVTKRQGDCFSMETASIK